MKQFFPKPNGLEHGFGSIDVAGLSVVFGAVVSELSVLTPPLTRRDSYARFVAMLREEAALLERFTAALQANGDRSERLLRAAEKLPVDRLARTAGLGYCVGIDPLKPGH
jgi:hypothetical protein